MLPSIQRIRERGYKLKELYYKYWEQLVIHRLVRFIESNYVMARGLATLGVLTIILGFLHLLERIGIL